MSPKSETLISLAYHVAIGESVHVMSAYAFVDEHGDQGCKVGKWRGSWAVDVLSFWLFLSLFSLAVQTLMIVPTKRKLREKEEDEDMCDYPSSMDENMS